MWGEVGVSVETTCVGNRGRCGQVGWGLLGLWPRVGQQDCPPFSVLVFQVPGASSSSFSVPFCGLGSALFQLSKEMGSWSKRPPLFFVLSDPSPLS